jgi:membrane protein
MGLNSKVSKRAHDLWFLVRESLYAFLEDQALRMAASLAFYATFSITPLLLVGLSIAGMIVGTSKAEGELVIQLERLLNPEAAAYIFSLVSSLRSQLTATGVPIVGFLGAIVAATTAFVELHSCLNTIWRVPPHQRKRKKLLAIVYSRTLSFFLVIGIGVLLMLGVVATAILAAVDALFTKALPVSPHVLDWTWLLLEFGMVPILLVLTYRLVPDTDIAWRDVVPAAVLGSVLFLAGKWLFGMYLKVTALGSLYGAAGSLFVFLAWVYYSAQVFFFGAELSKVYAQHFGSLSVSEQSSQTNSSEDVQ